jgi:uncharacterized protein (UPF0276 family)
MKSNDALPAAAGLGLRAPHVKHVLANHPPVPWFEVHSENYFAAGGPALAALERIRSRYPLSLHGVGLSLGSTDPLCHAHLHKLARLVARVEPSLVSEHLCWSGVGGRHYNDLLPLPFNEAALANICAHIDEAQHRLAREIAVENVSAYVAFDDSTMPEWEFVAEIVHRTGLQAPARRQQRLRELGQPRLRRRPLPGAMPKHAIAEIHLAGFETTGRLPDRHARRARRTGSRGRCTARRLRASGRARPSSSGTSTSRVCRPGSRGRDGRGDPCRLPCRRCVSSRSTSSPTC